MSKPYETIRVEREDRIAWIVLNRPHRLNALNDVMMEELLDALTTIDNDPGVRCVIITGEGDRAFSAGADITAFPKATPVMAEELSRKGQKVFSKIEELSKPVIAAINGYALGGGLELALACDFRIASEHAELGSPEINLGIIPGWGGTQKLVRIIGLRNAKRLVMLGERLKAEEALQLGLVDKVVPFEKLREEAKSLAQKLCNGPPIGLKYAKYALNFGSQVPLEVGLRLEAALMALLFSTNDVKRGIEAFMSKSKPEFKGD
ncbi:MAG: enoyl-CoA hydratase/isomerase family protein [Thaumarchaeota archaeon]|jgi:enoyl-CoA hydratase/3-hydroxyacyl-CoA dehydrogenase|nr:enoyl-CoA hydratase/isomerase family protein [Candidatus Geocrenenecus arthurdayi]MCL7389921.1 enoyl-CoA hydratase/isomerase family protein [Candidatus Geocrenenecus arthurdayi]MCL7390763.1 enoyl-CoA hydratase/isomerase family protein [Candidatus Geocrenenecus arthurdayi]MCL7396498.1 enoyl-CoA hydratase/isomerase family protein [Candidatus Geocrenenecus arthurdayi]MCL7401570.1 enoyl-CoA hydratase/isomerase family protein [Candidatus Geocrenenecus arthurdayi]